MRPIRLILGSLQHSDWDNAAVGGLTLTADFGNFYLVGVVGIYGGAKTGVKYLR